MVSFSLSLLTTLVGATLVPTVAPPARVADEPAVDGAFVDAFDWVETFGTGSFGATVVSMS